MGLTDREAADLRNDEAVSKAHNMFAHHMEASRHSSGMGFLRGLTEASRQLRVELVGLYAELDGAGEEPLRSELVAVINDRISSFIKSCNAGASGQDAPMAARTAVRLLSSMTMGVGRDLDPMPIG